VNLPHSCYARAQCGVLLMRRTGVPFRASENFPDAVDQASYRSACATRILARRCVCNRRTHCADLFDVGERLGDSARRPKAETAHAGVSTAIRGGSAAACARGCMASLCRVADRGHGLRSRPSKRLTSVDLPTRTILQRYRLSCAKTASVDRVPRVIELTRAPDAAAIGLFRDGR